ncbi:MAG: sugar phosphate isomerase/epimerase [Actinobacteria bacterium]|nr:sugar phosphate isomerase/epimerase [Actinomycetota bacterium]
MTAIAFTTANFVARETGWSMHGWGHGDRETNDRFRPLETFAERFDELLAEVRGLGFDTIDVWGAHLSPEWASHEHVSTVRAALDRHGVRVATYAAWVGPATIDRACAIARGLGTRTIGAGFSGDPAALIPALRESGVRLAVENHPERTPGELLAKIAAGDGEMRATLDTGWWATQGYDPVCAIEELGEQVGHVHLKDVLHEGEPHETCPWGEGIVDVEACVRALQRFGYGGALTIEHEPEDHDPSEEIRVLREQLEEWLR